MLKHLSDDLNLILDKTAGVWDDIKNQSIFVTGGTGFFGIWLLMSFLHANRTLNLNAKMILLTRDKDKFLSKYPWIKDYAEITFLVGNITDFDFIEEKVDYIIHAATEASVKLNLEEPLTMFDTIVSGTKRILDFAKIKKVKSFLMTSSGAIYGQQPYEIEHISENFNGAPLPNDPGAVYGEGKRMAEVLCAVYNKHYNLAVKIARCYAFVGPFLPLDSHFAAGNFISNILNGENITIEGDGTSFRSYMYSADLMIWLWKILIKGENNQPYNVGSNHSVSILELAQVIASLDQGINTEIIVKKPPVGKALRYVPNVDKAIVDLNVGIYTDLHSSIRKTIQFNKELRKS